MYDALRKLRRVSIEAYAKILKNRMKPHSPKWDPVGYDELGMRSWLHCSIPFLIEKLYEETRELVAAVENNEPLEDVLKEAGDVSNLAMFIADKRGCFTRLSVLGPKIVTLCGSTKFKDEFMRANFQETMRGNIVLSVGFFSHLEPHAYLLREGEKDMLDELHKRKIDVSDEILVLNVNQYIGDSTRSEIEYALATGKTVRWLEEPKVPFNADNNTLISPLP